MKSKYEKALESYPNIKGMLKGLNRQLWYIFLPASMDDLPELERAIVEFREREKERNQVMSIQNLSSLRLRPNESLKETQVKAELKGKMKKELHNKYKNRKGGQK